MLDVSPSFTGLEVWLTGQVAGFVGVCETDVDRDTPFRELGLSSVQTVELVAMIEDRYDLALSPTLLFEHPTLALAVEEVMNQVQRSSA